MSKQTRLDFQLADLFSDVAVPDPLLPQKTTSERVHDNVVDSPPDRATFVEESTGDQIRPDVDTLPSQRETKPLPRGRDEPQAADSFATKRRIPQGWRSGLRRSLVMAFVAVAIISALIISVFGLTFIVTLVCVGVAGLLGSRMAGQIARPVVDITEAARKMVAGDLKQSVKIDRPDELGKLGVAFNQMANQLRSTIGSLEETVAERTEQLRQASDQYRLRTIHLEASAEISRAAASILDPKKLMQTTAELIQERFDYHYVSFFLIDETGNWADVVASASRTGQQSLPPSQRLQVGGESLVGWVCAHGQPRVSFNARTDSEQMGSLKLPGTRSEVVVPLLVGSKLLGALDVQNSRDFVFGEDDLRTLQGMTDLIAITLHNAQLFTETQRGARHQQLITRVTDQMQQAHSLTDIMALTLEELGDTFDLAQATVCIDTGTGLRSAGTSNGGRPKDQRQKSV